MKVSGQLQAPAALSRGKRRRYPLDRRLGGPQSRYGRGGKERTYQHLPGIEPRSPSRSLATVLTELTQLLPYENVESIT
jgi:hypothetical protein